jgi:hypothetical protein
MFLICQGGLGLRTTNTRPPPDNRLSRKHREPGYLPDHIRVFQRHIDPRTRVIS